MKLISWNVNGLRAVLKKGFLAFVEQEDADIICLQETKLQPDQVTFNLEAYHMYFNSAVKKGYSGTALFSKEAPLSITFGMGIEIHDQEGRIITAEFNDYYVVTVYTPNSKRALERLTYRQQWEDDFKAFLLKLDKKKPVVVCGDLNVAHKEIDLKNPKSNIRNAGFTIEERNKMSALLEAGFKDSYRLLYPDKEEAYTWWSYMNKARERNIGWRIDYFLVSNRLSSSIVEALIYDSIDDSDHCPVGLLLK